MRPTLIFSLFVGCFISAIILDGSDGAVVGGTPSTTKISPWFNLWDAWPNITSLAPSGTNAASTGIDVAMQRASGIHHPLNAADREYGSIQGFKWTSNSTRARTVSYLGSRRVLICFDFTSGDSYGDQSFIDTIAGKRDDDIRGAVLSLPIGKNRPETGMHYGFYFAWEHEPEMNMKPTQNKTLYVLAVQHAMTVSVEAALAMQATPDEFGTGGLLVTAIDKPQLDGFGWCINLSNFLLNSGMVVWFEDVYFNIMRDPNGITGLDGNKYSPSSFKERIDGHVYIASKYNLTRFVVGETALALSVSFSSPLVGVPEMMLPWLTEVKEWLLNGGGEGVSTFSEPNGPASHNGLIRGQALVAAAQICQQLNKNMIG